jgi:hypothetical protein
MFIQKRDPLSIPPMITGRDEGRRRGGIIV